MILVFVLVFVLGDDDGDDIIMENDNMDKSMMHCIQ